MKSRILFILHLPPPVHGAATVGKYIRDSSKIRNEFNADFINLSTSASLTESGKGGLRKITTFFRLQVKVLKALIRTKYDLCYLTLTTKGPAFYKDLCVVFLFKLFKKKIIYHFHNKGIFTASENKLNHYLYRFALKKAKCILISPHLRYDVKDYFQHDDVFYCANGIPAYQPITLNKTSLERNERKERCRLLFLSNMMIEKGVFTLLDACKRLKEKGLFFECHFVGGWMDITPQVFSEALKERDLVNEVFAHGPKYNEEKFSFFKEADIFLLPSNDDVFPLVTLEAMQFGLPIVSTIEGGIPDIIMDGETGFLVPKRDAEKLAERLETLIKNPELRLRMGIAGSKRFANSFTLEKFEINLVDILKTASRSN